MAHYATIFISDVHLGTRTCQAECLVDFLQRHETDTLYLVGDIVDFWRIRRGTSWPPSHDAVLQQILRKVRSGTRVVFIPGNHDEGLRDYCGTRFGGVEIVRNAVHETADGKRYLVMHGDEYDVVVRYARWLALLGDRGYAAALALNVPVNWVRRQLGLGYWSLSAYLKHRVKSCVNHIGEFERALTDAARQHQVHGVICGHIHHAASRQIGDVHYVNTGDWVESCTAVVETRDGELRVVRWLEVMAAREQAAGEPKPLEAAA